MVKFKRLALDFGMLCRASNLALVSSHLVELYNSVVLKGWEATFEGYSMSQEMSRAGKG
jgi:hypothetical protein